MRRFFVDKVTKPNMSLSGNEHKHLVEVLRAKVKEHIIVCPNDGYDYEYEIVAIDKHNSSLRFVAQTENDTEAKLNLTVFFAMLKGDKSELVVTKLTELGVKTIVSFVSKYTVKTGEKSDRLKRAAVEACKQCGRAVLPEVGNIITFDSVVQSLDGFDAIVFAYESAYMDGKRLSDVVNGDESNIALIVGAEGGFADEEVEMLANKGVAAVTLGKRILKAETASIAAASVIMHICGEWD